MAACSAPQRQAIVGPPATGGTQDPGNSPPEALAGLSRYCHEPEMDLRLLARVAELALARAGCPAAAVLLPRGGETPSKATIASAVPILRSFRLMHLCGYCPEDIAAVVAHASLYLEDLLQELKDEGSESMKPPELTLVICVLLFVAHSYILDKNCPLSVWHKHVFARHCGLDILNAAILRVMEQRGYMLRCNEEALEARLDFLQEGDAAGILSGL